MKQYCDAVLNQGEIIDSTHTYKNIDLVFKNPPSKHTRTEHSYKDRAIKGATIR